MFQDFIIAKAKEQMAIMVAQVNDELKNDYLTSAANWALTKVKGAAGPPPLTPNNISAIFDLETVSFKFVETSVPVSTIKPEAFLPTYATDVKAVGGPVGGPIPEQEGKFYINSGASVYAGQFYKDASGVYVVQQPTPFQKYWLKIN